MGGDHYYDKGCWNPIVDPKLTSRSTAVLSASRKNAKIFCSVECIYGVVVAFPPFCKRRLSFRPGQANVYHPIGKMLLLF